MRAPTPVRGRRSGRWLATRSHAFGFGLASALGLGLVLATATTATAADLPRTTSTPGRLSPTTSTPGKPSPTTSTAEKSTAEKLSPTPSSAGKLLSPTTSTAANPPAAADPAANAHPAANTSSAIANSAGASTATLPTITVPPRRPVANPAHDEASNAGAPANTVALAGAEVASVPPAPEGAIGTRPDGTDRTGFDPSTRPANGTAATGWIGSDIGVAAFISGLAMLGLIAAADQRRLSADRHRR